MATITEDYVSFEVARLLKEKGFPQEYDIYHSLVYNEEDYEDEYEVQRMVLETKLVKAGTLSSYPIGVPEPKCYCCTLQMAMKWLRDVHDFNVNIELTIHGYFCSLSHIVRDSLGHIIDIEDSELWETPYYDSYEEACEMAIKYCLEKLI